MLIIACLTICNVFISHIASPRVITVPLDDTFNHITKQEHLYFNITNNYLVYLNSLSLVSSLSIERFINQFSKTNQPQPNWRSTVFGKNSTSYVTTSHYSIMIRILNLSVPLHIEFETHRENNITVESNDYFVFQLKNQFVNDLYTKRVIDKNMYVFNLNNNKCNEMLYIGGIPNEIERYVNDYKPLLNVSSKDIFGTMLQVGNKVYKNNSFFTWSTLCTKKMKLDKNTFHEIVNDLFSENIRSKTCEIKIENDYVLKCMKDVVLQMNFPKVKLIVKDNQIIEFKHKGLFTCDANDGICEAMFTASNRNNYYWSVGYALLKDYITVVDNENHLISVYETQKEMLEQHQRDIIMNCIKMELLFIISGLCLEIWIVIYMK